MKPRPMGTRLAVHRVRASGNRDAAMRAEIRNGMGMFDFYPWTATCIFMGMSLKLVYSVSEGLGMRPAVYLG